MSVKIIRLKAKNFLALGEASLTFGQGLVLIEGVNRDEAYSLSNGCLSGDTLIDAPRDLEKHPDGIPIKDLVGSKPVVYGMKNGKIVAVRATRVWQTSNSAEVVRVRFRRPTYHDGNRSKRFNRHEEIVGTPDHLVMLVDGTYKPLGKLRRGDRLMPLRKPNHEVISVESLGPRPVYDMEVPETSNFVANGVVVHNSGKSSLIEALFWGLYGKTIREGLKEDVINDAAGEKCRVEILLTVGGKEYKIRRSRKPNGLTLKTGRDALAISNGEEECWQDMTCHTVKETEKLVARIIGMPPERFLQTILLEGGMKAAFAHLTDTYRKQFLEEILGLQVWEKFQKATLWAVREAADEIGEFQRAIDRVKQDIGDAHRRIVKLSEGNPEGLEEEAREKQSKIRKDIDSLDRLIEEAEKLADIDPEHENEVYEAVKSVRDDGHQRVLSLRKQLTLKEAELHELESLIEKGECPTCGQAVKAEDFRSRLDAVRKKVGVFSQHLEEAENEQDATEKQYEEARTALDQVESNVREVQSRLRSLKREKRSREEQFEDIRSSLEKLRSAHDRTGDTFRERIEELKETLGDYQRDLKRAKRDAEYAEYWRAMAPELRASVMRSVLDYLNDRLELYSEIISDRDEVVQLVLDGSKIIIETRVGGSVKKHSMRSSGERRRTDLCVQFSLNDLAVASGGDVPPLLVLDEVLDPLDPISAKRVLELLDRRAQDEGLCILVTSHNPAMKDGLPASARTVTVAKEMGMARVE